MRISDWSSDVCSSDLPLHRHGRRVTHAPTFRQAARSRRLALAPPRGEQELGIAIGLFAALEHQIAGGVEGSPVKAGRHRLIERIARVLPVDHLGPAPARGAHLILPHYTDPKTGWTGKSVSVHVKPG